MRRIPFWLPIWLFVAGASIFLHGPMPLFSTRTLTVAWEMWQLGEWLIPHQNGVPYSHKAPLLYWLIHMGWAVGGVSDVWPKILEILLSALVLGLSSQLTRQLFPHKPKVTALIPWIMMGFAYFFLFSLQIMFELLLTSCVLLVLIALTTRDSHKHIKPRWGWVAVALSLGLLCKGPVMLLHVAFPILFAPFWVTDRSVRFRQWYGNALLSIIGALVLFSLWALPAAILGGEAYRQDLLINQTAGRVVAAFDHARPWWWYLSISPLLLFPWFFWRSAWSGMLSAKNMERTQGFRFALAWIIPTLITFSLISGKQAYYIIPLLTGFAIVLATTSVHLEERSPQCFRHLSAAFVFILLGLIIAALPQLTLQFATQTSFFVREFAKAGPWFGIAIMSIGLLLAIKPMQISQFIPVLSCAGLFSIALLHWQFSWSVWKNYDLQPAANLIAKHAAEGREIANMATYEGQFHFLARLKKPITPLVNPAEQRAWASQHPNDIVIDYIDPKDANKNPTAYPIMTTPFRSNVLQIWYARDWLMSKNN